MNIARRFPPCKLPPLTEDQILTLVKEKLGSDFGDPGYPPPNWRIHELRCIYHFQMSVGYFDGKPSSLTAVDGSILIPVTRDGRVFY